MPTAFAVHVDERHGAMLTATSDERVAAGSFVWIDVVDPGAGELDELARRFRLHPLAIEDAAAPGRLPKAEQIADEQSFALTRVARRDRNGTAFGQVAVFVGPAHVLSIASEGASSHGELRQSLERVPELLSMGVGYVLHGILSTAADSFTTLVDEIDDEVTDLERGIPEGALDQAKIVRLLALRREVKRVERMLKPMEEMARKLAGGRLPCAGSELGIYFRDLVDQIQRAQAVCDSIRDGLASVFEYSALIEQQRTGIVTRQLAAWAGIVAVPTAIAGIYGMNFRIMPELVWDYGYPVILAAMLIISLVMYWRFKRSGWL